MPFRTASSPLETASLPSAMRETPQPSRWTPLYGHMLSIVFPIGTAGKRESALPGVLPRCKRSINAHVRCRRLAFPVHFSTERTLPTERFWRKTVPSVARTPLALRICSACLSNTVTAKITFIFGHPGQRGRVRTAAGRGWPEQRPTLPTWVWGSNRIRPTIPEGHELRFRPVGISN